jgi:hypothetical protein
MPKRSDAAVGRLAIMDGALNGLLREFVTVTTHGIGKLGIWACERASVTCCPC